jgi:RNA polymerase sigma factor (sigma-70 family)
MRDPNDGQESTRGLARRGRAGDASAWDTVFARITARLRFWAHPRMPRATRGQDQTRDVVQDAALGVWRQVDKLDLRKPGDLEAYLREAVINKIRDRARRIQREPLLVSVDPEIQDSLPTPLNLALSGERWARYQDALKALTTSDREAIVARAEMGCSWEQVAEAIQSPSAAAARMQFTRAVDRLRAAVDGGSA